MKSVFEFIIKEFELTRDKSEKRIIAIDGIDASGKTNFSEILKSHFIQNGLKVEIIHLDDFHNSRLIRYKRGINSPKGFFEDSYNYKVLIEECILPFKEGKSIIKSKHFNLEKDEVEELFMDTQFVDCLILEGIFSHRDELINYWDFSVFLDVDFDISLNRNIERDFKSNSQEELEQMKLKYRERYQAGQMIYMEKCNPKFKANIVIDNRDFLNPKIIKP